MINKSKNKFLKALTLTALFFSAVYIPVAPAGAEPRDLESSKAFNLTTVVDNILNLDGESKNIYENMDEKTRQRQEFIETARRFNQGNVSVAYNDYSKIISEIDNDIALFVFSKSMYEIGFFTLGEVAISKVRNQTFFAEQIESLKKSYKNNYSLDKQEEIYLAKAYASIYFDNTPEETAFDLSKKTGLLEKSDYANFIMAQALTESRQYQQALMFIETAMVKNPVNPNYICYKIEILNRAKKYKEAFKLIEKYENSEVITAEFQNKFLIQKENILANVSTNENEKKFHLITINYINGDYYKVINECQNILNFNKNNYKLLTLQAQSQLNVGKSDIAKKNFLQSFDINKNYAPTLSGLGDISYAEGDIKKAAEYYKKALKISKNNTTLIAKLTIVLKNIPGEEKRLAQLEEQLKKLKKNLFYENYLIAVSMLKNDQKLRREYIIKSIDDNVLFENSQNEYLAFLNDNKRDKGLQNFLYMVSFVNNPGYAYYYYKGAVENMLGNTEVALSNIRHSITLNPDYEPADKLLSEIEENINTSVI